MLSPPDGLGHELLASTMAARWGITPSSLTYRPVGFGSHHWDVRAAGGQRWFLTADELHYKRLRPEDSLDAAFDRLTAALTAASDLRATGASFAVAPIRAAGGEVTVRAGRDFAVAVYPFVDGESFSWESSPGQGTGGRFSTWSSACTPRGQPPGARSRTTT